jgi:cobalt-zinc-cadmium efflux system outer membrane protein
MKTLILLILLLTSLSVTAYSQAPSASLTMDRVVASYIERNLGLQAARYRLERTRADQIAAKLRPNPGLSVTADNLRVSGPVIAGGLYEFATAYSETLELGGKREARIRVADANVSAAEARFADAMRQGIAEVKRLFLQAVLAHRSIDVAKENQQTFQGVVQLNLTRFQEGAIPEADLIKVRLERIKFDSAVRQAELSLRQAMIRLAENLEDPAVMKQEVAAEFDLRLIRVGCPCPGSRGDGGCRIQR